MTTVSEVMTRIARSLSPTVTVVLAAQVMEELNAGVVPVCEGDVLVGVVTDRDIAMVLADVMSTSLRTTREGDDGQAILNTMGQNQIRCMPVVNDQGRLIGILSIGDIAAKGPDGDSSVANSLVDISSPAEPDRADS